MIRGFARRVDRTRSIFYGVRRTDRQSVPPRPDGSKVRPTVDRRAWSVEKPIALKPAQLSRVMLPSAGAAGELRYSSLAIRLN